MGFFNYPSKENGNVGVGTVPKDAEPILSRIGELFYTEIPEQEKKKSVYHQWYQTCPEELKKEIEKIQSMSFWKTMCDKDQDPSMAMNTCKVLNVIEMDEIFYSKVPQNIRGKDLYGATGNYQIHQDAIFSFPGIHLYRVIIGMNFNQSVCTSFPDHDNICPMVTTNSYIAFDYNKTRHEVINSPVENDKEFRLMLKLHFIVAKGNLDPRYISMVKNIFVYHLRITRYLMEVSKDPTTFYQFFVGLLCQYYNTVTLISLLPIMMMASYTLYCLDNMDNMDNMAKKKKKKKRVGKMSVVYNIFRYVLFNCLCLLVVFCVIVTWYYLRFRLYGIR